MEKVFLGTGRRKSSVAQVKLTPGKGKITVNGRDVRDFFPYETNVMDLMQPLVATNNEESFDIEVKVNGGGFTGQTGAIRLGITRALLEYDKANEENITTILLDKNDNTRDAKIIENETNCTIQNLNSGLYGNFEKDAYINQMHENLQKLQALLNK